MRFGENQPIGCSEVSVFTSAATNSHEPVSILGSWLEALATASTQGPGFFSDQATAILLLKTALTQVTGPVFIDIPDCHRELRAWLDQQGFVVQRSFTRMLLGRSAPMDVPKQVTAITGPEFG